MLCRFFVSQLLRVPTWHGAQEMKPLNELREELQDLLDEAQAIQNLAEKESRDFTADESSRWDALMDTDKGLIAGKKAEVEKGEKLLVERKALAAARHAQRVADSPLATAGNDGAALDSPRVYHRIAKLNAFTAASREAAAKNAFDSGMWFRAVLARSTGRTDEAAENHIASLGWKVVATANSDQGSAGGFLVPDPLSAAFIEYRQKTGIARQVADVRPMTSDTLSIPKLTAGPTVYYPTQTGSVTASDQTWGQIALKAEERAILSKVAKTLAEDALVNVMDQLVSRMAYEFAKQEDNEFINGDGTGTYGGEQGLLSALGTAGVATADTGDSTWDTLDMDDFTNTMALLGSEYMTNPVWICSTNFYHAAMLRVLGEAGGNTIGTLTAGPGGMPAFLGRPVYLTDRMPTATAVSTVSALFGSFADAAIIGDRIGLEFAMSDQRYFEERAIGVLGRTRYDIQVHNSGTASAVGAYVGLKTAS